MPLLRQHQNLHQLTWNDQRSLLLKVPNVKCLPLLLSFLLANSALSAEPVLPTLIISDSGYHWLIQGTDGSPLLYKFANVVVIGKPTQGVPAPPTASEFGLTPKVSTWLDSVSDKADLVAVKEAINQAATMASSPGKLKTLGEVEAVAGALLSTAIKNKTAWGVFGSNLNKELVQLQTDKKITTPADYGRALLEISKALP
jgi:hypothetical protein